jgi:hypothetical protein
MAPESTVRGRENDFLVRPGYIHPQISGFSGGYGIFRRFTLWIKDRETQGRIEPTPCRQLNLSYTPRPQLPGTSEHQIENIKPFSDISGTEECKIPAWARDMFSLAHAVILHSSILEDISSMEEWKIPAWARVKMFRHLQGLFPFPELQFSRGELHFKYLL